MRNLVIHRATILLSAAAAALMLAAAVLAAVAQPPTPQLSQIHVIEIGDSGISSPTGLAFVPEADAFLTANGVAGVAMFTYFEQPAAYPEIAVSNIDPASMAYDAFASRLLFLDPAANQLVSVMLDAAGHPDPSPGAVNLYQAPPAADGQFPGITVDPASGHIFLLDSQNLQIIHIKPGQNGDLDWIRALEDGRVNQIDLPTAPQQIAFHPSDGYLYLLDANQESLLRVTPRGELGTTLDLSSINLANVSGLTFAPSADPTDDPQRISLYIVYRGPISGPERTRMLEFSLQPPAPLLAAPMLSISPTLIRTVATSGFSPASPDPAGIAYFPDSTELMISDSEVNEMTIFDNANLFRTDLTGTVSTTLNTVPFSKEPTGLALNLNNAHLFVSDDNEREIYELDPGSDGIYDPVNDTVTLLPTSGFGSNDPEGVAYDSELNRLFILDGIAAEVYILTAGNDGIFNGVSPNGDDQFTQFDVTQLGIPDPEGIDYNPHKETLFITGHGADLVIEVTTAGVLVNSFDISVVNPVALAGVAYAPGSTNPNIMSLYVTDRGIDNGEDPNENDGLLYEFSLGDLGYLHVFAAPDTSSCAGNLPCFTGITAVPDALDAVLPDGQVTIIGSHTITTSLAYTKTVTIVGDSDAVVTWSSASADSLFIIGDGNLSIAGLNVNGGTNGTIFNQTGSGTLLAYANNFTNFASGYSGSGSANLRNNWWGSGLPAPVNIGNSDAQSFRLGATVSSYASGAGSVSLADSTTAAPAMLAGAGGGRLVIVNHGNGLDNVPFGKGISEDTGTYQCADFYDFFVIGGSGNYTVTVPYKEACAGQLSPILYQFQLDGSGAPDLTCFPDSDCWDPITATLGSDVLSASFNASDLEGTPFAAPSIKNNAPTVISLLDINAAGPDFTPAAAVLAAATLITLVAIMPRRRLQPRSAEQTTPD